MKTRVSFKGTAFAILFFAVSAQAGESIVLPPVYPANGAGGQEFNWQKEWGSLHLNSYADGLTDPGEPATPTGGMPCEGYASGKKTICDDMKSLSAGIPPTAIKNGIKFDIKNSVLNCMSRPLSNWAKNHSLAYTKGYVCVGKYPKNLDDPRAIVYLPIWDPRANDDRDVGSYRGCQQQVINNCVRSIHECIYDDAETYSGGKKYTSLDDGPGYQHPVSNVFSAQEVEDLGGRGKPLPGEYYRYTKIEKTGDVVTTSKKPAEPVADLKAIPCKSPKTGICEYQYAPIEKTRFALAPTNPEDFPEDYPARVPGSEVEKIDNRSDSHLARIKTYRVTASDPDVDPSTFVIVDPSDFFDLNLYATGAKYDAGYNVRAPNGLIGTNETCPILGLNKGYGGICDPTGNAGCNLPIYKVGPVTEFKLDGLSTYSYNDYKVAWSGYVKKWSIINVDQYLKNIKGRERAYLHTADYVTDNPVLMLTRADDYCEPFEQMSDFTPYLETGAAPKRDMPCIQYLQYQRVDPNKPVYRWVDLYEPSEMDPGSASKTGKLAYDTLHLYNIDKNGKPVISQPVPGTGSDRYIGGSGALTGFLSFADADKETSVYNDEHRGLTKAKAVTKSDYSGEAPAFDESGRRVSGPVFSTEGLRTAGEYLGYDPVTKKTDLSKGAGVGLEIGTTTTVRMQKMTKVAGEEVPCVVINYPADGEQKIFIPTNTQEEFQSFVSAATENPVNGSVNVRKCDAKFMKNVDAAARNLGTPSAEGQTWTGPTKCDALVQKPSCNQAKMITARRFCQMETGAIDDCNACRGADDPDAGMDFSELAVGGEVRQSPNDMQKSRCVMLAACTNVSGDDCPLADTSGGHVFCLSPETKITMADGSQKAIGKIRSGERVKAFDAHSTRDTILKTARVKAVAVTKDQKIMKVNDLKITPNHKMVLASGRAVAASELKVGDRLMRDNGTVEPVKRIERDVASITVYNLVLDRGADGYIAGGMRVISYPDMKGLGDH